MDMNRLKGIQEAEAARADNAAAARPEDWECKHPEPTEAEIKAPVYDHHTMMDFIGRVTQRAYRSSVPTSVQEPQTAACEP
jgi:hypothetical protein